MTALLFEVEGIIAGAGKTEASRQSDFCSRMDEVYHTRMGKKQKCHGLGFAEGSPALLRAVGITLPSPAVRSDHQGGQAGIASVNSPQG